MTKKEQVIQVLTKASIDSAAAGRTVLYENDFDYVADEIVKLFSTSDVTPRLSVCENCSNADFNETMGCKNYFQGFKCENFSQSKPSN